MKCKNCQNQHEEGKEYKKNDIHNINEKMNTSFIGHHISSGGFIFYIDEKEKQIYTLLIRNMTNELWISKGHIEKNETHVEAALREFFEETCLESKYLEHVGLCEKISYSFEEFGGVNTKDVFINVFRCSEKIDLSKNIGVEGIIEISWYKYEDALIKISYDKNNLINSYKMLLDNIKKVVNE